jgi:hypothetical protein
MDGNAIGFISLGVPLGISIVALAFQSGRWSGRVATKLDELGERVDANRASIKDLAKGIDDKVNALRDSMDSKLSEIHKRVNSIKAG